MAKQTSIFAIRALALLALIVAAPTPAARGVDAAGPTDPSRLTAAPDAAPIVVAQGRCFNGRCF